MKRLVLTDVELRKSSLREGDLLFARRSLVAEGAGKCSVVKEIREPTTFESSIIRARPDSRRVDSDYLYYYFASPHGRELMRTILRQVAVSGITGSDLAKLEVPVPPLAVQRAFAAMLELLDDRIDLLRQTNTTLESIAQALFKSWFIDFDPVRAKGESREPEGMDAETAALFPNNLSAWHEQWQRVPVGKLTSNGLIMVGDGYRAKNSELGSPGVSFVRAGDLLHGRITPTEDILSLSALEKARGKMARVGDTAFTSKGTIGRFAYVDGNADAAVYSPQVCFWRSLNQYELQPVFLHFWMKSPLFSKQVDMVRGQAAIMDFVSLSDQRRMLLDLPSPALQQRFADLAEPILGQISTNREAARSLGSLRDALLPRLVSGKLRLTEAETQLNKAVA
ncbi:restriction endonuclease subunit S [Burkholderia stagnalis]|uniref:restriction endonuclease subunit S n=1 Tax=Burkholderia stagnalis TaxID=1503054 RepID=UPI0018C4BCE8|nr:restriction endonuclease subunit S [Burkholderia stagnalis]